MWRLRNSSVLEWRYCWMHERRHFQWGPVVTGRQYDRCGYEITEEIEVWPLGLLAAIAVHLIERAWG